MFSPNDSWISMQSWATFILYTERWYAHFCQIWGLNLSCESQQRLFIYSVREYESVLWQLKVSRRLNKCNWQKVINMDQLQPFNQVFLRSFYTHYTGWLRLPGLVILYWCCIISNRWQHWLRIQRFFTLRPFAVSTWGCEDSQFHMLFIITESLVFRKAFTSR